MEHHALRQGVRRRVVDLVLLRLTPPHTPHLVQREDGLRQRHDLAVAVMDPRDVVLGRERAIPHTTPPHAPLALLRKLVRLLEEHVARAHLRLVVLGGGDAVELQNGAGTEAHLLLVRLQVQVEGLE